MLYFVQIYFGKPKSDMNNSFRIIFIKVIIIKVIIIKVYNKKVTKPKPTFSLIKDTTFLNYLSILSVTNESEANCNAERPASTDSSPIS